MGDIAVVVNSLGRGMVHVRDSLDFQAKLSSIAAKQSRNAAIAAIQRSLTPPARAASLVDNEEFLHTPTEEPVRLFSRSPSPPALSPEPAELLIAPERSQQGIPNQVHGATWVEPSPEPPYPNPRFARAASPHLSHPAPSVCVPPVHASSIRAPSAHMPQVPQEFVQQFAAMAQYLQDLGVPLDQLAGSSQTKRTCDDTRGADHSSYNHQRAD